jgi:hypothetical protein
MSKDHQGSSNSCPCRHNIVVENKKIISNAYNLSRLNVEFALPIVHMHLYRNYKHRPPIKTFLQKLHVHEIRRKNKN